MDRVTVDTRRVDTRCRKGGAPGFRAIYNKYVVSDIAGKDRQLGMRDMCGVGSRVAADRCDCVGGAGDDRHRGVNLFEAFGQEGRAERRRHREHRAHPHVAIGAAVLGERSAVRLVVVGQCLGLGAQIGELGRRLT